MNNTVPATWRGYGLPLTLIVVGGLVVRYLHFSLSLGSDDQVWITVAREISTSAHHTDEPVYYTRLVWTWLLILWGHIGSLTLEWTAVLMFALSGLTAVFIAEATRASISARAALLAALAYAAHPLAIAYDTATLPDGLAVCLLTAIMWRFATFLRTPVTSRLIVPGLLIGLLFGVKNYFMLLSIPCALAILMISPAWWRRCTQICALACAAIGGLALTLMLGLVSDVDAGSYVASFGNYVRYISQGPTISNDQSARQILMLLMERADSPALLFFGFGTVLGMVTLFGFLYSVFRCRLASVHLFVASATALFLLFLMFMPVRLSPLTFTQVHDRYLTVLLPALSISAGAALAGVWDRLDERTLRAAAVYFLVAVVGYSAWVPNGMHDSYVRLEMRGLTQIVLRASDNGTTNLLLPAYFRRLVPDSYRDRGARLHFVDLASTEGAVAALTAIAADPSSAIAVFRAPYRTIKEKLRTGDYNETMAYGDFAALMIGAHARGYSVEEVRVPYNTARVWLARIGLPTRGQLVGWVVRKPLQ